MKSGSAISRKAKETLRLGSSGFRTSGSFPGWSSLPSRENRRSASLRVGHWRKEQIHFFEKNKIREYAILQKKIVSNALKRLSADGYLLYITCSVFKEENEENVNYLRENLNLTLIESKYLEGYKMQADTLFAALFKRSGL